MLKFIDFSRFIDLSHPVTKVASQDVKTCLASHTIADIIPLMLDGDTRIPVIDDKQHLHGMLRSVDVLDFLGGGPKYGRFLSGKLGSRVEKVMETEIDTVTPKHSVRDVLDDMRKRNIDSYPLVIGKKFSALVSESDFIRHLRGRTGIKVRDAMVYKPMIVKEHMPVADVASIMVRAGYRRLPVVSKGVLLGIVTPTDIISHLRSKNALHDLKAQTLPVSEIMNRGVVTVMPGEDLAVAIDKLKSGYGCLPVAEENELMGIITARDIVEILR